MKFDDTGWELLDSLAYNRRLTAFNNRVNSNVDRGDEHASVEYVRRLFAVLEWRPIDYAARARDEEEARKVEDEQ